MSYFQLQQQPDDQQMSSSSMPMSSSSDFDANAVPFLVQCLKNCIATRNTQQRSSNLASQASNLASEAYSMRNTSMNAGLLNSQQQQGMYGTLNGQQRGRMYGGMGEDVVTRGNVAKQALTYLANMSPEELGSITITGQSLTSAAMGATRAWNTRKQMSGLFGNRSVGGKRKYKARKTHKHRKHHK